MSTTYIVTLHGEPVTRITEEATGKPNVHTGPRADAIEYTEAEAAQVAAWIGSGAEIENTTTKPKHTPGPWRVVPSSVKGTGTLRRDIVSDGTEFSPSFVCAEVLEPDARIIAAAPDLLAALEAATEALEGFGCEDVPHYRAAIAKARGE